MTYSKYMFAHTCILARCIQYDYVSKNNFLNSVVVLKKKNRSVQAQKESKIKNKNTVQCTDSTECVRSV